MPSPTSSARTSPRPCGRCPREGRPIRRRLDAELVRRGIASSREQAREMITSGRVLVAGASATKAARQVSPAEPVELIGPPPRFVGRGGEKLDGALDRFAIDVDGRRALDAGASTGGFCDCLLQRGAASVVAIDVGYGQLHPTIREHPLVDARERTDIRSVSADDIAGPVDVVTADLSFISLGRVAPALVGLVRDGGDLVVLVKPQFEAGRREASKGRGIIRDSRVWRRVLGEVVDAFATAGAIAVGVGPSSIRGGDGNVEFVLHLRPAAAPDRGEPLDAAALDAVVAEIAGHPIPDEGGPDGGAAPPGAGGPEDGRHGDGDRTAEGGAS
ncbi:MAG: TlyA family RNA methyltransferase [Actinomycetota bacterium]|nr:TlyA family RNA methyltransferase [Actinomycetota bacterium]